ncbi:MAG: response regulator, partial [Roseiflexaceae bacterium]
LIIMDLHMPGKTGDMFVRDHRRDGQTAPPVILMTADSQSAKALEVEGIAMCLLKPFDLDDLLACVVKHIRQQEQKDDS